MVKCSGGQVKVNGICVSRKEKKLFGKASDEVGIIQLSIILAVSSIGSWAIFDSIIRLTKLDSISPLWTLLVGIIVVILSYKFGWSKM